MGEDLHKIAGLGPLCQLWLLAQMVYLTVKILFLLENEILKQLADLFNLSFMTGVFSSLLKTAKVVPVFKKDSKLLYNNYKTISLLSNIEKILEKYLLYTFLNKNNIIYNLQFGFRQQYSTCLN